MLYFSYSFVSYKGINEVKGIHICFVVTVVEIVNREDKVKGFMTALHKIIQITELCGNVFSPKQLNFYLDKRVMI